MSDPFSLPGGPLPLLHLERSMSSVRGVGAQRWHLGSHAGADLSRLEGWDLESKEASHLRPHCPLSVH